MKTHLIVGGLGLIYSTAEVAGSGNAPNSFRSSFPKSSVTDSPLQSIQSDESQCHLVPLIKQNDHPSLKQASAMSVGGLLGRFGSVVPPTIKWLSAAALVAVGGIELVTRFPSNAVAQPLDVPANTRHLVLILHGSGCKDEPTLDSIGNQFRAGIGGNGKRVSVKNYIWSPYSDNTLRAEAHAKKLGVQIGQDICDHYQDLESIHIISHSAGAFMQNPISRVIREQKGNTVHIESTFVDSMQMHGGFSDLSYGARHYGEYADFAQAIFTHNTPVPGCNLPLQHAFNIDMTEAFNNDKDFNYYRGPLSHFYPLAKYDENLSIKEMKPKSRSFDTYPKGQTYTTPTDG